MKRFLSILFTIVLIGCFTFYNYSIYEVLTLPYRAGKYPIPSNLGVYSNLGTTLIGGAAVGIFVSVVLVGISKLIARLAIGKPMTFSILFCSVSMVVISWVLMKGPVQSVLLTSAKERMENVQNSGVLEALEAQGFFKKQNLNGQQ